VIAVSDKDHGNRTKIGTMSLKGKIVFITGASGGIGAATALAFAAEGARLLPVAAEAARASSM